MQGWQTMKTLIIAAALMLLVGIGTTFYTVVYVAYSLMMRIIG